MPHKLEVIQLRTNIVRRHGGDQEQRVFELRIDGKVWEVFSDDQARFNYDKGKYLDKRIEQEVTRLMDFFDIALVTGINGRTFQERVDAALDEALEKWMYPSMSREQAQVLVQSVIMGVVADLLHEGVGLDRIEGTMVVIKDKPLPGGDLLNMNSPVRFGGAT